MQRGVWMMLVISGLCVAAEQLGAQERRGFWLAGGLAGGAGQCVQRDGAGDPRCNSDWKLGASGFFAGGGTAPSRRALLGLELVWWANGVVDTIVRPARPDTLIGKAREYGALAAVGIVYPLAAVPAYAKGGVGVGRYAEDQGTHVLSGVGFAVVFGTGVEFNLSPRWGLGPYVEYVYAHGMKAKRGALDALADPLHFDLVQVGIAVQMR